jgi:hypothetical protein
MTYSVMQIIELMNNGFPLLLNSVLSRTPILVAGQDVEVVDDITDSLTSLCPHRHKMVFWRDFTSEAEIQSVLDEEKHDYEVVRTVACSLSASFGSVMDRVTRFTGWIVAVPLGTDILNPHVGEDTLMGLISKVQYRSGNCGVLRVASPSSMSFSLARPNSLSLEVEKRIVAKILTRKSQSLERIRRLLGKSLRDLKVSEQIIEEVLKLDDEAVKLTRDVFEEEINGYVHAARRAVMILSRIRLARDLGALTTLTERNLYEAIGWDTGDIPDLARFINAEWHEDFSDCIKSGAISGLGAYVDSMWGT